MHTAGLRRHPRRQHGDGRGQAGPRRSDRSELGDRDRDRADRDGIRVRRLDVTPRRHDRPHDQDEDRARCAECGTAHPKWTGQCSGCGAWNTLVEEVDGRAGRRGAAPTADGRARACSTTSTPCSRQPQPTGIGELDRVLGGGIVPGSVTLLGGEPGIGKSTLLLQLLAWWPGPTLYVSAEESAQQVRLRAERLGAVRPELWLAGGDLAGRRRRRHRPHVTRPRRRRQHPDHRRRAAHVVARLGRPGARVRPAARRSRPSGAAWRSCWSATSPRTARSPGRGCSSTSSTPCCRSRASATTPCACCAP